MWRQRSFLTTILVAGAVYFLIVPGMVWRLAPPGAAVGIPAQWPHNQDIPLDIRISSWHSNYVVTQVRLFFDPLQSNVDGLKEPLETIVLLDREAPRTWNRLSANRFTFPRRETMHLIVPLAGLAAKRKMGPGTLVGTFDVFFSTAGSVVVRRQPRQDNTPFMVIQRIPFRMELQ